MSLTRYVRGRPYAADANRSPGEESLIASSGAVKYLRGCNGIRIVSHADTEGVLVYHRRPQRSMVVLRPRDMISSSEGAEIRTNMPVWENRGATHQAVVTFQQTCAMQFVCPGRWDSRDGGIEVALVVAKTSDSGFYDNRDCIGVVQLTVGPRGKQEVLRGAFILPNALSALTRLRVPLQMDPDRRNHVECVDGVRRPRVPQALVDMPDPVMLFDFAFSSQPEYISVSLLSVHIDTFPSKPTIPPLLKSDLTRIVPNGTVTGTPYYDADSLPADRPVRFVSYCVENGTANTFRPLLATKPKNLTASVRGRYVVVESGGGGVWLGQLTVFVAGRDAPAVPAAVTYGGGERSAVPSGLHHLVDGNGATTASVTGSGGGGGAGGGGDACWRGLALGVDLGADADIQYVHVHNQELLGHEARYRASAGHSLAVYDQDHREVFRFRPPYQWWDDLYVPTATTADVVPQQWYPRGRVVAGSTTSTGGYPADACFDPDMPVRTDTGLLQMAIDGVTRSLMWLSGDSANTNQRLWLELDDRADAVCVVAAIHIVNMRVNNNEQMNKGGKNAKIFLVREKPTDEFGESAYLMDCIFDGVLPNDPTSKNEFTPLTLDATGNAGRYLIFDIADTYGADAPHMGIQRIRVFLHSVVLL